MVVATLFIHVAGAGAGSGEAGAGERAARADLADTLARSACIGNPADEAREAFRKAQAKKKESQVSTTCNYYIGSYTPARIVNSSDHVYPPHSRPRVDLLGLHLVSRIRRSLPPRRPEPHDHGRHRSGDKTDCR